MNRFSIIIHLIDDIVWGTPMITMVILTGLIYTLGLRFLSVRGLKEAFQIIKRKNRGVGEVSVFSAICTTLAANLGTGNIIGVATALVAGGPGALLWIWVAGFLGMAIKYGEGLLSVKYRSFEDGHALGGPFFYIERGMGSHWKWLAKLFAFLGSMGAMTGIGTTTQMNGIVDAVRNVFDPEYHNVITLGPFSYSTCVVLAAIIITVLTAFILSGGLKRIAQTAELLIPFLGGLYLLFCLLILLFNITSIPHAIYMIFVGAFHPSAITGGAVGSFMIVLQRGISRGIFSSETGMGSAPIAAAAAKIYSPEQVGLVTMISNLVDTLIVCMATGVAVVITDSWNCGLDGVFVATRAFSVGLPFLNDVTAAIFIMICLVILAFTTIIGWEYYGERCFEYLFDGNHVACIAYRGLYVLAVFIGAFMTLGTIWTISDIFTGLMAFPNLLALLILYREAEQDTFHYFHM